MVKSLSSDVTNLSSYCSFDSIRRNASFRKKQKPQDEGKSILEKFMRKKDLPSWYRALSNNQMKAIDSLFDNIRDDSEQGTSHRCRYVLLRLGLYPLESSANISLVLKLCKGNDLAFLWFLMDLFYNDTCDECTHTKTKYNINQQLLMTAIAHLDMITTIRELDKILPQQPKLLKEKPVPPVKKEKPVYSSPYLEQLPRPILINRKKRPPLLKPIRLEPYTAYMDPNYVVRNEANRWYAIPETEQEEVDMFKMDTSGPKIVKGILRNLIKAVCRNSIDREKVFNAFCKKHQELVEEEKKVVQKIQEAAKKEQLRQHFNLKDRKKIRGKKTSKQIEKDAQHYHEKCTRAMEAADVHTWVKILIDELIDKAVEPKNQDELYGVPCPGNKDPNSTDVHECRCHVNNSYDFGHWGTPKPHEIYFHAPSKSHPYKFDYNKIFKDDLAEKSDPVKAAIFNALDMQEHYNEDAAIKDWLKENWKKEVITYNKGYINATQEPEEEKPQRYDPRNNDLMDSMLSNALKKMRENPKFVLASLPDAHKYPILKEWIRRRYGLIYSKAERKKALKVSKNIFEALRNKKLSLKSPTQEDIGIEKVVSYVCRNYVYHKSNRILATFFHNLKMNIMEHVRIYWMAMEPFLYSSGAPRGIFYSYMPSREYDIMPFKPWDSGEYMDAKKEWEKRVQKREAEEEGRI